tara:strand:- start:104 stop:508 length:405 start_codon:yes stop_codon:yes gene_type:complete
MYSNNYLSKPILIEPGVSHFFSENLKLCQAKRNIYINNVYNVTMFLLFMCILFMILYYKYTGKLTPYEKIEKTQRERLYILNKVKTMKLEKAKQQQELITNLPIIGDDNNQIKNILPMTHPATTPINLDQKYYK